jgi:hypothetical protein
MPTLWYNCHIEGNKEAHMKRMATILSVWMVLWASTATISEGSGSDGPWVIVSDHAKNNLEFLYENLSIEFAVCAYGRKIGSSVLIEKVDLPKIYGKLGSFAHLVYEDCPGDYRDGLLGVVHSHPVGTMCRFSPQDKIGLVASRYTYDFIYCQDAVHMNIWQNQVAEYLSISLGALSY